MFEIEQTNLLVTEIIFQPNAGWVTERYLGFKLGRDLGRDEKERVGVTLKED